MPATHRRSAIGYTADANRLSRGLFGAANKKDAIGIIRSLFESRFQSKITPPRD